MININGNNYKLCLFDTNALSSLLLNQASWIKYFDKEFGLGDTIICYSAFSIAELYFRKELFDKFIDLFSIFPSAMIDGYEGLFQKEVDSYDNNSQIDFILLAPFAIKDDNLSPKDALILTFKSSGFIEKSIQWRETRPEVIDSMLKLKDNYPPKGKNYTIKEIEEFMFISSITQIGLRNRKFAQNFLKSEEIIDVSKFPSLKSMVYTVFYKFYTTNRKATDSDMFDIIIASAFPYVDYCITEGNLCEIFKQVQNRHDFSTSTIFYSLKNVEKIIG